MSKPKTTNKHPGEDIFVEIRMSVNHPEPYSNGGHGYQYPQLTEKILRDLWSKANKFFRHRFLAEYEAARLWEKDPEITIEEMAYRDELNHWFEGRVYKPKTIRNWIKHLCPDRSPGRRPTEK